MAIRVGGSPPAEPSKRAAVGGLIESLRARGVDATSGFQEMYARGLDLRPGASFGTVSVVRPLDSRARLLHQGVTDGEALMAETYIEVRRDGVRLSHTWGSAGSAQVRAASFRAAVSATYGLAANGAAMDTLLAKLVAQRAAYMRGEPTTLPMQVST